MNATQPRQDDGFTLVELVLSLAILIVIIGSITSAMIVFLKTGGEASARDDHSIGAATAASYVNRDLASAGAVVSPPGTVCSSKVNQLALTWVDYVATSASPSPSPGPASTSKYVVAYAVAPDAESTAAAPGHAARYELERWYCAPGVPAVSAVLVRNLRAITDFSSAASASCSGGLKIILKRYGQDTASSSDYTSSGCLQGRLK